MCGTSGIDDVQYSHNYRMQLGRRPGNARKQAFLTLIDFVFNTGCGRRGMLFAETDSRLMRHYFRSSK